MHSISTIELHLMHQTIRHAHVTLTFTHYSVVLGNVNELYLQREKFFFCFYQNGDNLVQLFIIIDVMENKCMIMTFDVDHNLTSHCRRRYQLFLYIEVFQNSVRQRLKELTY